MASNFNRLPHDSPMWQTSTPVLTKREWFAGMALQGLLANMANDLSAKDEYSGYVQTLAVNHADALIKKLEEQPDGK